MQFFSINQIGIGKGTKLFHAFTNRTNFSGKLLRICVYRRSVALQLIHSVAINIYIYVLFITRHIRFVHTLHSSTKKKRFCIRTKNQCLHFESLRHFPLSPNRLQRDVRLHSTTVAVRLPHPVPGTVD